MKARSTLRSALILRFLLAAGLPLLVIGWVNLHLMTENVEREIIYKNQLIAESLAGEVERFLDEATSLLNLAGEVLDRKDLVTQEKIDAFLEMMARQYRFFESVQILDERGLIRYQAPFRADLAGIDMSGHAFFKETRKLGKPFWSNTFISTETGAPTLTLTIPLPRGMIVGYLNLSALNGIADRVKIDRSGYAAMADREGVTIAHPDRAFVLERLNVRNLNIIRQGLAGHEGTFPYVFRGVQKLGSVAIIPQTGWVVVVIQSVQEAFAPARKIRNITWIGMGFALVLAIVMAFTSLRKTLRPLSQLIADTRKIAHGDYRVSPPPESYPEIDELARDFTIMSEAMATREAALREAEQKYRHVVENVNVGIMVACEGRPVFVNPGILDVLGYTEEAFLSHPNPLEFIHPDDRAMVLDRNQKRLKAEVVPEVYPYRVLTKDGDVRWVEDTVVKIDWEGKSALLSFFVDISDRKLAEEAIQKSEKRYRELFDSVTDLIYTQDLEGRFMSANRAMTDLFAYDPKEFIGKRAADFMKPELRPYFDSEYLAGLKEQGHYEGISAYFTKDGRKIYLEYRSALVRPDEGEPYISGISRDVTERVAAERALREREERIRTILQASPNPMVVYDTKGRVQFLNTAFSNVFGWALDELREKRIPFVPDEQMEETLNRIRQLYKDGTPMTWETQRSTRDGRPLDVLISAALIKGAGGVPTGMVVSLSDLTEKKRTEAALLQALKMEAVGTLAGGVAHDFNNLLMGIQGNASLMLLEMKPGQLHYEKLRSIETYVQQGADLTRQLLGFAKGGKYEVKPTDLNELIENESRMFARTRKEIRIVETYEPDLWPVAVDRGQMAQVLLNLYINASKAMPGGGEIRVRTENACFGKDEVRPLQMVPGKYVRITVSDTGVGMDEATQKRIFEPFFTTREMGRGTGLGLASVYGIIKNHDGYILVASEKGRGATFDIFLPAIEADGALIEKDGMKEPDILRGNETILFVDDEEMILEIGSELLKNMGYEVLSAGSGREAIEIYRKNRQKIDVVILDMVMPDMGGGAIFDELRKIDGNVKVLLSSGYSIDGQASEILNRGCSGFIQKPFNMKQLSHKLREILDTQHLGRVVDV